MKVLHISGATGWGGNEQQLVDIIPALEKVNVTNLVFGVKNSVLQKKCIEASIPFLYTKEKKLNKFSNYKLLKTIIKKEKPDIIHIHTSDAVTVYVLSDLFYKLKTLTVFSKKGMSRSMSWLSKYKYNYKNIKAILCVSNSVKDSFKAVIYPKNHYKLKVVYDGINNEKIENIHAVNLRENYSIKDAQCIIGNIANHTAAKDLVTLVKTADELINNLGVKHVHFVQIGSKNKSTQILSNLIENYHLQAYFTMTGFIEKAMDLLPQIDVFIMTSEREGGPSSVLDAMHKRIPVVTTKVGVTTEAIIHQENGMLSEIKDYKDLAKNLKELIENKEKQNGFTEKSYKVFLDKFTTKHLAENTFSIYDKVINNTLN